MLDINYTTGPATLADDPGSSLLGASGSLQYGGCVFSPLFETTVSGTAVKDNARRTIKYMEYTLTADGYVTLPAGASSIAPTMANLRTLLTSQGETLVYRARGFDIVVNNSGAAVPILLGAGVGGAALRIDQQDVAWGPAPEILEFQPLGGGLSAKVKWQCKFRVPERNSFRGPVLLQFNTETKVSYGEDGYSTLSIRGTMEIPLTHLEGTLGRRLTTTVDQVRNQLDKRIFDTTAVDLSRFRVIRREYSVSRDKRTLEFDIVLEEKPYMDLPPACTVARGSYSVRPVKSGMGLVKWLCTLRATYTVSGVHGRRDAWFAFLALMRLRMAHSTQGITKEEAARDRADTSVIRATSFPTLTEAELNRAAITLYHRRLHSLDPAVRAARKAFLIDFSVDEGLYLDSKTITFAATWRLTTLLSHILLASGIWRKLPEKDAGGNNLWSQSVKPIMGSRSWLPNTLDPSLDVIVDFGGG